MGGLQNIFQEMDKMHLLKKIFFVGLLQINGAQKIILISITAAFHIKMHSVFLLCIYYKKSHP